MDWFINNLAILQSHYYAIAKVTAPVVDTLASMGAQRDPIYMPNILFDWEFEWFEIHTTESLFESNLNFEVRSSHDPSHKNAFNLKADGIPHRHVLENLT